MVVAKCLANDRITVYKDKISCTLYVPTFSVFSVLYLRAVKYSFKVKAHLQESVFCSRKKEPKCFYFQRLQSLSITVSGQLSIDGTYLCLFAKPVCSCFREQKKKTFFLQFDNKLSLHAPVYLFYFCGSQ